MQGFLLNRKLCKTCKVVGHVCGGIGKNTTRFKPAAHVQKKVHQIWKPQQSDQSKQVDKDKEGEAHVGVAHSTMHGDPSLELMPQLDFPITPLVPVQDDGWRVVSRRKGSAKSPVSSVGLAQIHTRASSVLNEESGELEGGSSALT